MEQLYENHRNKTADPVPVKAPEKELEIQDVYYKNPMRETIDRPPEKLPNKSYEAFGLLNHHSRFYEEFNKPDLQNQPPITNFYKKETPSPRPRYIEPPKTPPPPRIEPPQTPPAPRIEPPKTPTPKEYYRNKLFELPKERLMETNPELFFKSSGNMRLSLTANVYKKAYEKATKN
jgi:hypothetical protein